MISDKTIGTDVFTDFSSFEPMRKAARENSPEAVHAVAKKLEGVFLNMMMSSMREANQLFSEDSLLSSKDVRFYQQMLDQQLSVTLSEGKGIGLADAIKRQIEEIHSRRYDPNQQASESKDQGVEPANNSAPANLGAISIERYRVMAVPAKKIMTPLEPIHFDQSEPDLVLGKTQKVSEFAPISPQDFVEKITPYAKRSAAELGVPVEAIVAQAALETGWGRYTMKNADGSNAFNFFGIKAGNGWQGEQVNVTTLEYRNGIAAKETASFRSYASLDEAFKDYSNFLLKNPRYQKALDAIRESNDAKSWGNQLQQAGYATDPNYGKKIASIVARLQAGGAFHLTQK